VANPYTVFDLSVGRSRDAPTAFLKGYTGFVHADGYAGYNQVYEAGARRVGCMMHARRYFFDARLSDPERAHEAIARIRALYAVERGAKGLSGNDPAAYRVSGWQSSSRTVSTPGPSWRGCPAGRCSTAARTG
jgi:hypothetical protein